MASIAEDGREELRAMLARRVDPIFGPSGIALTLADPHAADCPIFYANSAFETATGYSSEAIIGRNCRFLQGTFSGELGEARAALRNAIRAHVPTHAILMNVTAAGEPFVNSLFLVPVQDGAGESVAILGSQFPIAKGVGLEGVREQAERMRARARRFAEEVDLGGTPGPEVTLRSQFQISRAAKAQIEMFSKAL